MNGWGLLSLIVTALSGLGGVWIGQGLQQRHERRELRRGLYSKYQRSLLKVPTLGEGAITDEDLRKLTTTLQSEMDDLSSELDLVASQEVMDLSSRLLEKIRSKEMHSAYDEARKKPESTVDGMFISRGEHMRSAFLDVTKAERLQLINAMRKDLGFKSIQRPG